jgi:hypothetical protein
MPTISQSPQAAQKRVWKAEIRAMQAAGKKVSKDIHSAILQARKEHQAAAKQARSLHAKWLNLAVRLGKTEERQTAAIKRRIGILNGRLGL